MCPSLEGVPQVHFRPLSGDVSVQRRPDLVDLGAPLGKDVLGKELLNPRRPGDNDAGEGITNCRDIDGVEDEHGPGNCQADDGVDQRGRLEGSAVGKLEPLPDDDHARQAEPELVPRRLDLGGGRRNDGGGDLIQERFEVVKLVRWDGRGNRWIDLFVRGLQHGEAQRLGLLDGVGTAESGVNCHLHPPPQGVLIGGDGR